MPIVVLQQIEGLIERRVRHEHGAQPVMNQSAGHVDGLARLPRRQALDVNLAAAHFGKLLLALGLAEAVDPEKRLHGHLRLGRADVAVERGHRLRLQVGGGHGARQKHEQDDAGGGSGSVWR